MIVHCTVCDQKLDSQQTTSRVESEEEHDFFCSEHCRALFDQEPELYLDKSTDDEAERLVRA